MALGTSSPIHAVHALFPMTPKIAASATTATKTRSAVGADHGMNGSAIIGSHTSRDAAIAVTATILGPNAWVSQAPGSWTIWAASGSAPMSPMARGLAPRCSAQAVRMAPPAHAPKNSATTPSA